MRGGKTLPSMREKDSWALLLLWTLQIECEARGACWNKNVSLLWTLLSKCEARGELLELKDTTEEEFPSSPSWIHGQTRGWIGQVILAALFYGWEEHDYSIFFSRSGSYMLLYSFSVWMILYLMQCLSLIKIKIFFILCLNDLISDTLYFLK